MGTPSLNLPNFSPDDNTESSGRAGCPVKLFFPPADNFRLDLGTGGAICLYRLPGLNLPADFYLHLFGVLVDDHGEHMLYARLKYKTAFNQIRYSFHDYFQQRTTTGQPLRNNNGSIFMPTQGTGTNRLLGPIGIFCGNPHTEVNGCRGDSMMDIDFSIVRQLAFKIFSFDQTDLKLAQDVMELQGHGFCSGLLTTG